MADAGVSGVVTADVLDDFSNDVVLTTQWIDGEPTTTTTTTQQQQQSDVASSPVTAASTLDVQQSVCSASIMCHSGA
jgi:predicted unusual protein kinase regulating ubiquinone biosynthesis (AarF/ABC1/UbiB family)